MPRFSKFPSMVHWWPSVLILSSSSIPTERLTIDKISHNWRYSSKASIDRSPLMSWIQYHQLVPPALFFASMLSSVHAYTKPEQGLTGIIPCNHLSSQKNFLLPSLTIEMTERTLQPSEIVKLDLYHQKDHFFRYIPSKESSLDTYHQNMSLLRRYSTGRSFAWISLQWSHGGECGASGAGGGLPGNWNHIAGERAAREAAEKRRCWPLRVDWPPVSSDPVLIQIH